MTGPDLPPTDPFDLAGIQADDQLLDDLAAGHGGSLTDPAASLLSHWRTTLRPDDLPAPPVVTPATRRRRSLPAMAAASVAIIALLFGTAAIGARSAGPDDMLWPLTQILWSDRVDSVAAREHAVSALEEARVALHDGEPPRASVVLTGAAVDIERVQERDGRSQLDADYLALWTEVELALVEVSPSTVEASSTVVGSPSGSAVSGTTVPSPTSGSGLDNIPTTSGPRPTTSVGPTTGPGTSNPATPPVTTTSTPPATSSSGPGTTEETTPTTTSGPELSTVPTPPSSVPSVSAEEAADGDTVGQGSAAGGG